MLYRFEKEKDTKWSSYDWQKVRYETIKHLLGGGAIGAEIGVYRGGFAEFLLPHCELLYLLDPWYIKNPFWSDEKTPQNSSVRACLNIMNNYIDEMESGQIKIVINYSVPFLRSLQDNYLDWVYIDSSHTYKNTLKEIQLSAQKVKNDGFIIGDDYHKPGVIEAANEFCRQSNRKVPDLILNEKNQWAMRNIT